MRSDDLGRRDVLQALAALPNACVPIPHFGASDCRMGCPAHLIAVPPHLSLTSVWLAAAASIG